MDAPISASTPRPKKARSANYTGAEKAFFVGELMPRYREFIENKKTDFLTTKEKEEKWTELAAVFNASSPSNNHRSVQSLKNLWDNLKRTARSNAGVDKAEGIKTGGGQYHEKVTQMDLLVLSVLGVSGVGGTNSVDSDADSLVVGMVAHDGDDVQNQTTSMLSAHDINSMEVVFADSQETVEHEEREEVELWDKTVPHMLYRRKPTMLRVDSCLEASTSSASVSTSIAGNSSSSSSHHLVSAGPSSSSASTTNSPAVSSLKKRSAAEEAAWAKQCKRRRPSLPSEDISSKLAAARLDLAILSKQQLEDRAKKEEERQRREEERKKREEERAEALFQVELEKRQLEAAMLKLQVIQKQKELGVQLVVDE